MTTFDSSRSSWCRAQLLAPSGMRETPLAHYRSSCFATSFEQISGIIGVGIVGVVHDDPWCALCVSSMIERNIILLECVVLISWVIWCAFTHMYIRGSESRPCVLASTDAAIFLPTLVDSDSGVGGFDRQIHARWARDRMGIWTTMRADRKA